MTSDATLIPQPRPPTYHASQCSVATKAKRHKSRSKEVGTGTIAITNPSLDSRSRYQAQPTAPRGTDLLSAVPSCAVYPPAHRRAAPARPSTRPSNSPLPAFASALQTPRCVFASSARPSIRATATTSTPPAARRLATHVPRATPRRPQSPSRATAAATGGTR